MRRHITIILFLVAVLGVATCDVWAWGHAALTVRTCTPKLYYANGIPRTTNDSYIVFVKHDDTDSTYIHPDLAFNAYQGTDSVGVWCFNNLAPWSYFMIDTIGGGSVIAFPMFVYPTAKVVGDTSITTSTAFDSEIIPTEALEDSLITGVKAVSSAFVSKHITDGTIVNQDIATDLGITSASKAAANIWDSGYIDETDTYTWSGDNTHSGKMTFTDTIFVSGVAAKERFTLFIHPDAVVSSTPGTPTLEFFEYTPGTNVYGAYAYAVGGAQSRIMTPWFPDGGVFEQLWFVPNRVDADSSVYFTFHYALHNVAVGDSVSWDLEWDSYALSVTGTPGEEIESVLSDVNIADPAPFTVGQVEYYDYTIAGQSTGELDGGSIVPGEYFDFRATVALGVGDSPICLIAVYATAAITRILPCD